jgi:hypothetical protein
VDLSVFTDYLSFVAEPMALSTVRENLIQVADLGIVMVVMAVLMVLMMGTMAMVMMTPGLGVLLSFHIDFTLHLFLSLFFCGDFFREPTPTTRQPLLSTFRWCGATAWCTIARSRGSGPTQSG